MFVIIIIIIIVILFIAVSVFSSIQADKANEKKYVTIDTKGKETLLFELTGVHLPENRRYTSGFVNQYDNVTLEFEPENIYDENAIMVLHSNVNIGYVPSFETDEVKQFMLKYDYCALIYKKEIQSGGYLYMEIGLVQK